MNIKSFEHIYLLGVGGIGMSALARYFVSQNKKVFGYDKVKSDITINLEDEGVQISYIDDVDTIPEIFNVKNNSNQLVIYSSAITNNKIFSFFSNNSFKICKRAEALGLISKHYYTIAVAGTHGKTTTSVMLAHILKQASVNCTAFLGGISKNYNTNFLLSEESKYMVVEADEYDRSFLSLYPDIAIITSLDSDHLDIYKNQNNFISSFQQFASQVKDDGCLIIEESIVDYFKAPKKGSLFTYSNSTKSDYYSSEIQKVNAHVKFNYNERTGKVNNTNNKINLSMLGDHNISNALAAIAASSFLKIDNNKISDSLNTFYGIKRRFDIHHISENKVYIDDYAHHPKEILVTIDAVKKFFKGRNITVVFQPHLFSRTQDFAADFASSLSMADSLIILDIYPAREKPIEGVDSKMILDLCVNEDKQTCLKDNLISVLEKKKIDVLLSLGAGDISDLVGPISKLIKA